MDEEELQQPQKKIDIDSFFNRVDAVEGVASNALKQSNLNANTIQANKTLINSISVTIEAMRTEIRDIANYIVIENKLEKDKKEDEKFEAEDKEQKENLADRLKAAAQGAIQPKDIKPGTEEKGGKKTGGGFLGGLFKIVAGLGLAAGLIALAPYIVPALLIGAGGLLLSFVIAKITPPIVNFVKKVIEDPMKYFASAIRNTLGKVPLIKGPALAWADSLESGAEKLSNSTADSVKGTLENVGKGGDGKGGTGGGVTPAGGGDGGDGGGELKENNSNMSLNDKSVETSSENILDSVGVEGNIESEMENEGEGESGEKKKIYVVRGTNLKFDSRDEAARWILNYIETKKKPEYEKSVQSEDGVDIDTQNNYEKWLKIFGQYVSSIKEDKQSITADEIKRIEKIYSDFKKISPYGFGNDPTSKGENLESEKGKIMSGERTELSPMEDTRGESTDLSLNQPPGNSFNNNNNVKNQRMQLDSQVSSAEIKGTGTTIRAVRMTSNQFLSTHDKNIPIEVLRTIA
tara:strand:+ start:124 stop:1680 length:1557 start_codon:yes stop_codon:yes gene_type:complete